MGRFSIVAVVSIVLFGGVMNAQAVAPRRTVLIFVDDLHIDLATTPALRSQLRQAVDVLTGAGRVVELTTDTLDGRRVRPTSDGPPLSRAIRRVTGIALRGAAGLPVGTDVGAMLERRAVATEAALLKAVAGSAPDSVLYVSEAPPARLLIPVALTAPRDLVAAARRLLQPQRLPPPSDLSVVGIISR